MPFIDTLDRVPSLRPDVALESLRPTLSEEEWRLVNALDGVSRVRELARRISMPRERAHRVALDLAERGLLVLAEPPPAEAPVEEDQAPLYNLEGLGAARLRGIASRAGIFRPLIKIHRARLTGILRLSRADEAGQVDEKYYKNLYFLSGQLIDCRSHPFQPAECLGRILQRAGRMEQREVIESLRKAKERGVRQGEALLEMGVLTPDLLQATLEAQLEVKVGEIFRWEQIGYEFAARHGFPARVARIDSRLGLVLFNAAWKNVPDPAARSLMERFKDLVVGRSTRAPFDVRELQFERILGRLWYETLEKDVPFRRVLITSKLKRPQAYRALFCLYAMGMIEFFPQSRADLADQMAARLAEELESLRQRSYFDVLGVHWSATDEQIGAAFQNKFQDLERQIHKAEGPLRDVYLGFRELIQEAQAALRSHVLRKRQRERMFDREFLRVNAQIVRQKAENLLFAADDPEGAARELRTAIEIFDEDGESFALLGLALFRSNYPRFMEECKKARDYLSRAIEMRPDSDLVHLADGIVAKAERDGVRARRALEQALRVNPQNALARIELEAMARQVPEEEREKAIGLFLRQRVEARATRPKKG